jgi:hypothetical protein
MNHYRVDRVAEVSDVCPCGMNSILYLGNDMSEARKVFLHSRSGIDTWGKQNKGYGVGLYRWHEKMREYLRIGFKDSHGSVYMHG